MTKEELSLYLNNMLLQSTEAASQGEVPVSCAIVLPNNDVIYTHNNVEKKNNPFSHAEYEAIHMAMEKLHSRYLFNCTLIVSMEPCLFCMGAILKAGIKNLYYILDDEKLGSLNHYHAFVDDTLKIHQIEDVRFKEIMDNFFKTIREKE